MPVQNVNIKNVSMDYFLRGVDAAKPQGAPQAPQGAQEGANAPAPEQQAAGKMVSQLDVLLMKAAKASTKSLDGSQIKKTLQKLVDDGAMSRDSLKLLAKTADTAAKTLKALDKFTGRQLAEAFDENGDFDATTKAGKAIAAAVKAQQDLSDLLAQIGRSLGAMSRHEDEVRQSSPQFKGVDEELLNEVNEFRQLCDRRETEITRLAYQMKDFAVHLAANGQNADPSVVAILKAKVNDLLPRQALAMHGTADALATVHDGVSGKLRVVADKIDTFRRNPTATITKNGLQALQSDLTTMKAALKDICKNGIDVGGGRMVVAKDIVAALEKEVAKTEGLFKSARKEVARIVLGNYVETANSLLCASVHLESQFGDYTKAIVEALELRDAVLYAMDALVEAALDPAKKPEEINALITDLNVKGARLMAAAKKTDPVDSPSAAAFNAMLMRLKGAGSVALGLCQEVCMLRNEDRFFTGAEAMAVFKGEISVSSIVEARVRGLQDSDVDPANEDVNIVSECKLGAGATGTVFELTRTDGTSVVFKGETESRAGLSSIAAGGGKTYDLDQKTVNLNIAAKKAAVALGMGDMIVDYSAGSHNGVFGFYMEKARGMSARDFGAGASSASPGAGMSPKEIKDLPAGQRLRVKADLQRELNRLQWLDLVTGQADRHWSNYFVHVDPTSRKVTVKGIDNDAGYSQYRIGAVKFTFDTTRSEYFKAYLKLLAKKIDSNHVEAVYNRLLADPGITDDGKGHLTIDASKLGDKVIVNALRDVTGVQTVVIPDKIDRETYNALMELKGGPKRDAYLASIRPRLSQASYDAAVSRLDDVIARAEALGLAGKVIEGDDWLNVQEVPHQTGKVTVKKQDGSDKQLGGVVAKNVNNTYCPSIFARDGLSKIFD